MKYIVASLMFLTILAASALGLTADIHREQQRAAFGITTGANSFMWSDPLRIDDPEVASRILVNSAETTDVNIIRRSIQQVNDTDRLGLAYYVYFNHRSGIADKIDLRSGRFLSVKESQAPAESAQVAVVESSQTQPNSKIVGQPRVLANDYQITVLPFSRIFTSLPVEGTYFIEADSAAQANEFLNLVAEGITSENRRRDPTAPEITPTALESDTPSGETRSAEAFRPVRSLVWVLLLMVVASAGVALARASSSIGVLRMHGYSLTRVWWVLLGKPTILAATVAFVISGVVVAVIPGTNLSIGFRVLIFPLAGIAVLTLLFCAIGLAAIARVRVSDLMKGRLS